MSLNLKAVLAGSSIGFSIVALAITAWNLGSHNYYSPTFQVGECYVVENPHKEAWDKTVYFNRIDAIGKESYKTSLWVGKYWIDSSKEFFFQQDKMKLVTCPQ